MLFQKFILCPLNLGAPPCPYDVHTCRLTWHVVHHHCSMLLTMFHISSFIKFAAETKEGKKEGCRGPLGGQKGRGGQEDSQPSLRKKAQELRHWYVFARLLFMCYNFVLIIANFTSELRVNTTVIQNEGYHIDILLKCKRSKEFVNMPCFANNHCSF